MTLTEVINDEIKNPTVKYVALSGPTHAEEVSIDMPTTIVSACKDIEIAKIVQCFFTSSFFTLVYILSFNSNEGFISSI